MNLMGGLALVLVAGVLQGSFVLPMTLTRQWRWEHTWAIFSLLGMLIFNWTIGLSVLPHFVAAIISTPSVNLGALCLFGTCWGLGAILFGLGMEKLGMAVGYPVIMGLILSLGALIPLVQSGAGRFLTAPGLLLVAGTTIVLWGIVLCARASARRTEAKNSEGASPTGAGLAIAIFAGILSCLPNVGLSNATQLTASALRLGASPSMAGNGAWVLFFTAGFVVNFLFCGVLILKRSNLALLAREFPRNLGLVAAMSLMWIASFYLYGMGAARMGQWGAIIGWPLFISLAILVGNLWGLWRGEWRLAPLRARSQLNVGLIVVLIAVALFGLGSAVH